MPAITPSSPEELAAILAQTASLNRRITLAGNDTKRLMAGPIAESDLTVSTCGLRRVLHYEPHDLTVSVEAGMPFSQLQSMLADRGQMLALDPPFSAGATIGGVVASNSSGPLRRGFGTARDLIIGMTFTTLEGKLIKTGGMVVKNVAGLDLAKIMVGSFGTLAAITSVNFRVHSLPEGFRSFLFQASDLTKAMERRDTILKSVLQPIAVDLLSPAAAEVYGRRGYVLAIRASGSQTVLDRYERDLAGSEVLNEEEEKQFWRQVGEFTPEFLERETGVVLRISTTLTDMVLLLQMVQAPSVSRAGSGVTYVHFADWEATAALWKAAAERGWTAVVEFAADDIRKTKELWQRPTTTSREQAFAMMKRVKQMFDPGNLLNRSRLYGRI
jgi:glycolate oxidase FAD binding subunit